MADRILIVDDDKELRSELKDFLEGYEVLEAPDGEAALKLLRRANDVRLVILDVRMPGMNGLDVLTEIKKTDPDLMTIVSTGYSSKDVAIEALKGKADDYMEKPLDFEKLGRSIESLIGVDTSNIIEEGQGSGAKIARVRRFVEKNWYKKITLDDVADEVCLSPKYLSRIFKLYTKKGFSNFKLELKMGNAKDLLKKSGYNINQISERLGYENTESFIRQFKKMVGCTPAEYRKKRLNRASR